MPDLRDHFRAFTATVGCDPWRHQVEAASTPCLQRPVDGIIGRAFRFTGTIPALTIHF